MKRIAIFASGTGSNADKIIQHLSDVKHINISFVLSNRSKAGVQNIAKREKIDFLYVTKQHFYDVDFMLDLFASKKIDFIVLAGFLWMIPEFLIDKYPKKIINIHPALLPNFGGKGMYGMNVHKAVKASSQSFSGMTIHYVNENYDEGEHIFQAMVKLNPEDDPEQIAKKVLVLEHTYYPLIVESLLSDSS